MLTGLRLTWRSSPRLRCRCLCQATPRNVRVRFAPSPTGQLHLGGMRTALYNFLFARVNGGTFILRIEDTDQTRFVPGAQEQLIKILNWGKIHIDEGPDVGGEFGPYVQSQRLDLYREKIKVLLENKTAYRCFCSERRLRLLRHDAVQQRETPKYDNNCRHLTQEEIDEKLSQNRPYVVRLKLEHHREPWTDIVYGPIVYDVASIEGDPVLMKSDGYPTYHFANVVDDHHMQISHVLRGVEWQVSTTKHILLYKAFGWQPPQFGHLPLLLNKDGKKLSKRQDDVNVEHYVSKGYYPETLLSLLTDVGSGFKVRSTAGMSMEELIQHFDISLMNTNSTRLDFDKLNDMHKSHFRKKVESPTERQSVLDEFIAEFDKTFQQGSSIEKLRRPSAEHVLKVVDVMKDRIQKISDLLIPANQYLWFPPTSFTVPKIVDEGTAKQMLQQTVDLVKDLNSMEEQHIKDELTNMCEKNGWDFGCCMKVLRMSLSSSRRGPSIGEMMTMLGREDTISRLGQSINIVNNETLCK